MIDIYTAHKAVVWIGVVVLTVLLCLIHYEVIGPRRTDSGGWGRSDLVRRFGTREKVCHWLGIAMFLALAVTGVLQVSRASSHGILGAIHARLGIILGVVFALNLIGWLRDSFFRGYDLVWLKGMGGYLSRDPVHLPSGRFNAGQKTYFWLMLFSLVSLAVTAVYMEQGGHHGVVSQGLFWSVHGLIGCFVTAMVIGHGYLSVLANPETARVLWDGKVPRGYAEKHHSRWSFLKLR